MNSFKSLLFKVLPESTFKNKVRCFFYNRVANFFSIHYNNDYYQVDYGNFSLLFIKNPFHLLMEQSAYFIHYSPKNGDVVIDGGGFWGTVAIYMSKLVGDTGKVIVYEPDESNLAILNQNIKINNIQNIEVVKAGIWNKNTTLEFSNNQELGSSFLDASGGNKVLVPVVSLDEEVKRLGLSRVDFIKMDIEGAELEAIEGASKLLEEGSTNFAIASYHIVNGEPTFNKLEQMFHELTYKSFTEHKKESITYAFKEN